MVWYVMLSNKYTSLLSISTTYTNTNRNSNPNNIILWNLLYSVIEIRESKSNWYLFRHRTAQHGSINNTSLYWSQSKEECLFRYSKTRIVKNSNDNQSVLASDITSLDHPKAKTDVYKMNGDVQISERNGTYSNWTCEQTVLMMMMIASRIVSPSPSIAVQSWIYENDCMTAVNYLTS